MVAKKSGLGKGLDSLIPSSGVKNPSKQKETVKKDLEKKEEFKVRISKIEPNRDQPRKVFD